MSGFEILLVGIIIVMLIFYVGIMTLSAVYFHVYERGYLKLFSAVQQAVVMLRIGRPDDAQRILNSVLSLKDGASEPGD